MLKRFDREVRSLVVRIGRMGGFDIGDGMERKLTVRETSSRTMLNLEALLARFSRTSRATFSRWVISWLALNCATTLFNTSLTIEGSTRSS